MSADVCTGSGGVKSFQKIENGWRDWVRERSRDREVAFRFLLQDECAKEVDWVLRTRPDEEYLKARMQKVYAVGARLGSLIDPLWMERLALMEWILLD